MKKEQALVSVVIPCFNDGVFLEEAVQSVNNSTYKNVEIIIVNDGSTDNTREIGIQLQNRFTNVKYLEQNNAGPARARNYAISTSRGKYILPLDADDIISDNYIEDAVTILHKHSNVKVVYSNAEFFGEKTGKWNLPEFSIEALAIDNMIFCSGIYRKSDYLEAGGYSDEMIWGWEDWEFWISMLKNGGDVYKIPKTCFYYRIKPVSRRKGTNKAAKKKTIDLINNKHKEYIFSQLNGPLRYSRSLSKTINSFINIFKF